HVDDALFLSGIRRNENEGKRQRQGGFRAALQLQLIQDKYIQPDIILDITDFWEKKEQSILAYTPQFNASSDDDEPQTYISNPTFMESTRGRAAEFGRNIQVQYAEGFTARKLVGVQDLFQLIR